MTPADLVALTTLIQSERRAAMEREIATLETVLAALEGAHVATLHPHPEPCQRCGAVRALWGVEVARVCGACLGKETTERTSNVCLH